MPLVPGPRPSHSSDARKVMSLRILASLSSLLARPRAPTRTKTLTKAASAPRVQNRRRMAHLIGMSWLIDVLDDSGPDPLQAGVMRIVPEDAFSGEPQAVA